jgi:tetratricopeptide (TPR) repeat protein
MFSNLFKRFSEFLGRGAKPLKKPINPYVTGNVVGGGQAFVGRAGILQGVKADLRHPHQNAIILYGQRRIGKTSILKELEAKLPETGDYRVVYFDLMGKVTQSLPKILDQLADEICLKLSEKKSTITKPDWCKVEFHTWLARVVNEENFTNQALIILFDEFDAIDTPHAEQVRDEFFHYLREELLPVAPQKLKFIFAIGRNLGDFQSALVLLRTMTSYHVSLLTESETAKLIRLSENSSSLYWSTGAIRKIWELTQGHPYLTQLLSSLIFDQLWAEPRSRTPTVSRKMVGQLVAKENVNKVFEKAVSRVFEKAVSALEWLWDGLTPACKIDTAAFAELGDQVVSPKALIEHLYRSGIQTVVVELETAPKYLKEWDIIEGDQQLGYRFRVELFRQWVALHKPLKDVLHTELGQIRIKAQEYYQQAQTAYHEKQLDAAVKRLRDAIFINPQFIEAHQLLITVLQEKRALNEEQTVDDLNEVQTVLEKFYACCPDIVRSQLTEFLWARAESCTSRNEKLAWCEKILTYDPEHATAKQKQKEILRWQAKRFEEDAEYESAMEALAKADSHEEMRRVWWKSFWEQYGKWLRGGVGFAVAAAPVVYFRPAALIPIPWWLLAPIAGIAVGLIIAFIPLRKSTRKRL